MANDPRLNVQSGPFKGQPQQWFTRSEVERLLLGARTPMLGEVWMAFGQHDGKLIALPEYAAASAWAVKQKIAEVARREGYTGSVDERITALGWTIRRMALAHDAGVREGGKP